MKKLIIYTAFSLTAANGAAFAASEGDCRTPAEAPGEKICWTKPGGQYTLSGKEDLVFGNCGSTPVKVADGRKIWRCWVVAKASSHDEYMGVEAPKDVKIHRCFSHNQQGDLVSVSNKCPAS